MSRREITNIPASVRARLLKRAREQGESFDQIPLYSSVGVHDAPTQVSTLW